MSAIIQTYFTVRNFGDLSMGEYFLWGGDVYQKTEHNQTVRSRDGRAEAFFDEEQVEPVDVTLQVTKRSN